MNRINEGNPKEHRPPLTRPMLIILHKTPASFPSRRPLASQPGHYWVGPLVFGINAEFTVNSRYKFGARIYAQSGLSHHGQTNHFEADIRSGTIEWASTQNKGSIPQLFHGGRGTAAHSVWTPHQRVTDVFGGDIRALDQLPEIPIHSVQSGRGIHSSRSCHDICIFVVSLLQWSSWFRIQSPCNVQLDISR